MYLSDSKQDMWAYGLVILVLLGVKNSREQQSMVSLMWEDPDHGKEQLLEKASHLATSGNEKMVLDCLVDIVINCLCPTPGQRYSARDVINQLLTPETELSDLGDFFLESEIVGVTKDGVETKFSAPFGSGFFGSVYYVKLQSTNECCGLRTLNDAMKTDADNMLQEIRLINKLRSSHIVRYIGVVYEEQGWGSSGDFFHQSSSDMIEEGILGAF